MSEKILSGTYNNKQLINQSTIHLDISMMFYISIGAHNFHICVHVIYPEELEIKDNTESDKSASYLDILLDTHSSGRMTASLYDKGDYFDFAIVSFPFLCSNISLSPAIPTCNFD
jgi:hypothetical protein